MGIALLNAELIMVSQRLVRFKGCAGGHSSRHRVAITGVRLRVRKARPPASETGIVSACKCVVMAPTCALPTGIRGKRGPRTVSFT